MNTSFQETLAQRIQVNPAFQRDYSDILNYSFTNSMEKSGVVDTKKIQRLAESAIILASSPNDAHNKTAFEIASTLYEQFQVEYPGIGGVTKLICSRLGNIPAIDLLDNDAIELPVSLEVESEAAIDNHTVIVGNKALKFTEFQHDSYELLSKGYSLSLSAPTSAGKSFLITHFVANQLASRKKYHAVVIVPTRALIRQLVADFSKVFFEYKQNQLLAEDVTLFTASFEPSELVPPKALFILTQERLQAILYNWKNRPKFDLLVVDESQKIGDKKRGIILEDSINELIVNQPDIQAVFLSPLASNPDFLLELTNSQSNTKPLHTVVSPVAQHVYSVKTSGGKKGKISISRIRVTTETLVTELEINRAIPSRRADRLAFIAKLLSRGKSSIIYSTGPSDAERNALALTANNDLPTLESEEINEIRKSLSDFIHEEYYLVDCLEKGVGYHFGAMPDIAKVSVENLFKREKISYIACTSTLLEGVNLPAKNIFIDSPKLGKEPMDDSSFWNLAGRAGRLMKDLSGNVFCINQDKWEKPVAEREREYKIKSSLNVVINSDTFASYCQQLTSDLQNEGYEQAANNLLLHYMEKGEQSTREFLEKRSEPVKALDLVEKISVLAQEIKVPVEILKKNKSIDIRLQQGFMNYLASLNQYDLRQLIPTQPLRPHFNLYAYLSRIFELCDKYFVLENRGQRYKYFAVVASQWVEENPLKDMILSTIKYKKEKDDKDNINRIIRELISSLNEDVRFHYVRTAKCLCDLLQYELDRRHFSYLDDVQYVDFSLPNYLELGMCQKGSVQLHSAGLSRTTSIIVNRYCKDKGLSQEEILGWVKENTKEIARRIPRPCSMELLNLFS